MMTLNEQRNAIAKLMAAAEDDIDKRPAADLTTIPSAVVDDAIIDEQVDAKIRGIVI